MNFLKYDELDVKYSIIVNTRTVDHVRAVSDKTHI